MGKCASSISYTIHSPSFPVSVAMLRLAHVSHSGAISPFLSMITYLYSMRGLQNLSASIVMPHSCGCTCCISKARLASHSPIHPSLPTTASRSLGRSWGALTLRVMALLWQVAGICCRSGVGKAALYSGASSGMSIHRS